MRNPIRSYHDRRLARRLRDEEFRKAYEKSYKQIAYIDRMMRTSNRPKHPQPKHPGVHIQGPE